MSEREIAKMVGKSASTVNYHVRALLRQWRASQAGNIDKWRARQLARIAAIESEAWQGWSESKRRVTTTQRLKGRAPRPRRGRRLTPDERSFVDVSRSVRMSEGAGNEAFLARLAWCVAERNLMFGFYGLDLDSSPVEPPSADEYAAARQMLLEVVTGVHR